jgi:Phage tail repeat like
MVSLVDIAPAVERVTVRGQAVTIEANVNAANDEITFQQGGAGAISFLAGAGMTLSTSRTLVSGGPGAVVGIKFLSATEATIFGHTIGVSGGGGGGGCGDMAAATYDPTSVLGDAFARANHHGEQGIGTITGLQAELDGKAAATHAHAVADVTGLQAELDGKAPVAHAHAIADTTGLQAALDDKAAARTATPSPT